MTTRKTTTDDVQMLPPCDACDGTGLVRINEKYRKTCQACQGTKVKS